MHPAATVSKVLELSEQGHNSCEISRRTGVPRPTVRDWASGKLPHSFQTKPFLYGVPRDSACDRCGGNEHRFHELSTAYAYLLGLYLGDGAIASHPRGVFRLRITLDVKYPGIIEECVAAMEAILPWNHPGERLRSDNCVEVYSYSKSWPCLLPQHGPGKKHLRTIKLEPWQQELVDLVPGLFLRGLIHSDGCRFMNTGRGGWRCPRYAFSNVSEDIRNIFCRACDVLDVHWTLAPRTVYVSKRRDVELLDTFIGPKR